MGCDHNEFRASVNVGRLTDDLGNVTAYTADVRVSCRACGTPFEFNGLPMGVAVSSSTVSVDGQEARLSIAPAGMGDASRVFDRFKGRREQ